MSVYDIEPGGSVSLRDHWESRSFMETLWLLFFGAAAPYTWPLLAMVAIASGLLWALL